MLQNRNQSGPLKYEFGMCNDWLAKKYHIKSYWTKLILGSAITALLISLGMVVISQLLDFDINSGIIAALAAIGTAVYATRVPRK